MRRAGPSMIVRNCTSLAGGDVGRLLLSVHASALFVYILCPASSLAPYSTVSPRRTHCVDPIARATRCTFKHVPPRTEKHTTVSPCRIVYRAIGPTCIKDRSRFAQHTKKHCRGVADRRDTLQVHTHEVASKRKAGDGGGITVR